MLTFPRYHSYRHQRTAHETGEASRQTKQDTVKCLMNIAGRKCVVRSKQNTVNILCENNPARFAA